MTEQHSGPGVQQGQTPYEAGDGGRSPTAHDVRSFEKVSGALEDRQWFTQTDASLMIGQHLESLGRPSEAMLVYESALEMPEAERSPFDIGRLLHRIGTCAVLTEDWGKAFKFNVLAAREAHDLGMKKPCGASLSVAGSILIDFPPAKPIGNAVSEDLAWTAFLGVVDTAQAVLLGSDSYSLRDALQVRDQFVGLVVLSASAAFANAPLDGSKALFHEVVIPFAKRHGVHDGVDVNEASVITAVFDHLARLASHVADQGRQAHNGIVATEADLKEMIELAAVAFIGPSKRKMLRWISAYLRDHRGANWATDERTEALAGQVEHT